MIMLAASPKRDNTSADYTRAVNILLDLPDLLEARRTQLGLNLSQQAKGIGIARSTMTGLAAGKTPSYATIIASLRWLATN